MCTSAGATSRGQTRPSSSWLSSAIAGDRAGDADAVGAHRDGDELAVLVEHLAGRAPRRTCGRAGRCGPSRCRGRSPACRSAQFGQGSPSRTSAASMVPSAVKSRPATRSSTWLPATLAPVTQRVPSTTRGSTQVADARLRLLAQHAGADVALDERRVLAKLGLVHRLDLGRARAGPRAASGRPRGRRAGRSPAARGCRRGA